MSSLDKIFKEAIAALNSRRLFDAERLFKKILKTQPTNVAALNLLVVVLMSMDRFVDAEVVAAEAVRLNRTSDVSYYNYGIILKRLKKPALALNQFDSALHLNSQAAETWNNRGTVLNDLDRYDEAVLDFDKAVDLEPKYAEAYCNKGRSLINLKRYSDALAAFDNAKIIRPHLAEAWLGRGAALIGLKRYDEALVACEKTLVIRPDQEAAWLARADILFELKRYGEARFSYDKVLEIRPNSTEAWVGCGNVFACLQRYEAGVEAYGRALVLNPQSVGAWLGRGNILVDLNRYDEALVAYERALALKSDVAEVWLGRGNAHRNLGRYYEALASYDKSLLLKPDLAEAHLGRADILCNLRRLDEAVAVYDKVLEKRPDFAEAWLGRGNLFHDLKRFGDAMAAYDRAIEIKPNFVEVYTSRGYLLSEFINLDAAIAEYDRAIAIKPNDAQARWNKSLALLSRGDFAEGWRLFEWRWETSNIRASKRQFRQPLWLGSASLADKTILLYTEQGLGDAIQFCRYAVFVADLGAHVILEVQKPLRSVFTTLRGVAHLVQRGDALPAFDFYCPLMSLPLAFETTLSNIPANIPYLTANPEKSSFWKERLGRKNKRRVGLVWSGGVKLSHREWMDINERRNIPLIKLAPLKNADVEFYSLQKGQQAELELVELMRDNWEGPHVIDFTSELIDFSDTAALIDNLDLVISVDTSVVHLAGALGKPTWVLNRFDTDWRWLLDRTDSPWYPSVKLYRQERSGNWDDVIQRVKEDLERIPVDFMHNLHA